MDLVLKEYEIYFNEKSVKKSKKKKNNQSIYGSHTLRLILTVDEVLV